MVSADVSGVNRLIVSLTRSYRGVVLAVSMVSEAFASPSMIKHLVRSRCTCYGGMWKAFSFTSDKVSLFSVPVG